MNLHFGFLWQGLVVFTLPMLINIVYFLRVKKTEKGESNSPQYPILEITENVTRILYFASICFFVSEKSINYSSQFMKIAIAFLLIYYLSWILYFAFDKRTAVSESKHKTIILMLAIFPVLYFIFAALWLDNIPVAIIMIVFGTVHLVNSLMNIKCN